MSRETVEWVPVSAPEQVREVAALAKEIWGEHYRGLLTPGQITYMVDRFQSEEAITLQLSEGYQYRLITVGDEPAGYAAYRTEEGRLFLSKLYVRKRFRRRGLARRTVDGLNRLMVDLCMGCGSCTFVCPAKRPVAQTMSLAKVMQKNGGKK